MDGCSCLGSSNDRLPGIHYCNAVPLGSLSKTTDRMSNAKPSLAKDPGNSNRQKAALQQKGRALFVEALIQRFEGSGGRILALNTPLFGTFSAWMHCSLGRRSSQSSDKSSEHFSGSWSSMGDPTNPPKARNL
jgi:hypothetical protein